VKDGLIVVDEEIILALHVVNVVFPVAEKFESVEAFGAGIERILCVLSAFLLHGPRRRVAEVKVVD